MCINALCEEIAAITESENIIRPHFLLRYRIVVGVVWVVRRVTINATPNYQGFVSDPQRTAERNKVNNESHRRSVLCAWLLLRPCTKYIFYFNIYGGHNERASGTHK